MPNLIKISSCHQAEVYKDNNTSDEFNVFYRCEKCDEKCEVEDVCEDCLGTGEVSTDETDSSGNIEHGVGTRKCLCQYGEPADFSGATEGDR